MNSISSAQVRRLSGFGRNGWGDAYVFEPERPEGILEAMEAARKSGRKALLRGAGRSYGDAAYLPEAIAIDTRRMNVCAVDTEQSIVRAGPGTTIEDLWRVGLPVGLWPPVVSGTMRTSLGGGLAMNIHGKNAFKAGTLGEWVDRIQIATPSGELRWMQHDEPEFMAVVSSAGLIAAITNVELRMKRVKSGMLSVQPVRCRNWDEQFSAFESNIESADYMVSWVDMFSHGKRAGRGLFHAAIHLDETDERSLRPESQDLPPRIMGLFPKSQVWKVLHMLNKRGPMRALNAIKQAAGSFGTRPYRQSLVEFSFLLDYVPGWEKAYLPHGLIQYQCFVPATAARSLFEEVGSMCRSERLESFLGVMKRHRTDGFLLSHGVDGYSLALDFKVAPGSWNQLLALCHRMNDLVLAANGKFYLAKDSTLRPEDIRRYVPPENLGALAELKSRFDPDHILDSALNRRLHLV